MDLMIAAIARVHGATVITRNAPDFDGCGVPVVNPWAE
jgi:toxin FitB